MPLPCKTDNFSLLFDALHKLGSVSFLTFLQRKSLKPPKVKVKTINEIIVFTNNNNNNNGKAKIFFTQNAFIYLFHLLTAGLELHISI